MVEAHAVHIFRNTECLVGVTSPFKVYVARTRLTYLKKLNRVGGSMDPMFSRIAIVRRIKV